jgi:putative hydrolase of the HAD superfamily
MISSRIKVISFDLDDTLWDIDPVIVAADAAVQKWLQQHCPDVAERYTIEGLRELRGQLLKTRADLQHQISRVRICALEQALLACDYSETRTKELAKQGFDVFLDHRHAVVLFEHVEESLAQLSEQYQLGVITNGNADINKLRIGHYFSFALAAEQLNASKPSPIPFRSMLELTGKTPSEVIHIGDHHEHDIEGAQQMGIHTIWVNLQGKQWPGRTPANEEIGDYLELIPAIRRIEAELEAK